MGAESGVVTGMPMEGTVMDGTVTEGPSTTMPAPSTQSTTPPSSAPKESDVPKSAPAPVTPSESTTPPSDLQTPADVSDQDDMFDSGDISELPGADDATGEIAPPEESTETPPTEDVPEDLFNDSTQRQGISVESLAVGSRKWTDNTGRYATVGKLVRIGNSFVRLEKSTGRTCTVPFSRLCDSDYAYVQTLAAQVGLRLPIRLASAR
jgi:SLA1 homology domain 1, SHD1